MIAAKTGNDYTEITKVFAGGAVQQEIIKIWSSAANDWVYEATDTVSGTLPLTFHADGSALVDYQVYGAAGGVGDRTENQINVFATNPTNGFIDNALLQSNGNIYTPSNSFVSEYFPISENAVYTYYTGGRYGESQSVCFYDDNKDYISGVALNNAPTISFTTPPNAKYYRATVMRTGSDLESYKKATFTLGDTPPASFVPYGYKLDMVSSDGTKIPELSTIVQGGWSASAGTIPTPAQPPQSNRCRSTKFYPINGTKLIYNCGNIAMNIVWIDASGVSLGGSGFLTGTGIIDVKEQAKKVTFIFAAANTTSEITPSDVIESSPTVLPCTTTPIYIGDAPLESDEYVDYQEQKMYRRTENKYDISTQFYGEGLNNNGNITKPSSISSRSDFISVTQNTPYTKKSNIDDGRSRLTQFFDDGKTFITQVSSSENPTTFTTPNRCAFVRIAYQIDSTQVMLVEGSDTPAQFIPYLQPTDPPVPLPALPTCEGNTVIDYNGTPAPSSVYLKYKKGW